MNEEAQSSNGQEHGPAGSNGKHRSPADQPCFDPTAYGNGPDDFVTDMTENAAITHHAIQIGKEVIAYTATAGHLVTPPAPYTLEDNPDSLLDKSDLIFVNPVGTGYSAAIAPHHNRDFWGVDQDADSLKQFIKRYLSANDRWNSPKFLYGESYGTARSCVLAYRLHEDGVDLNGITLQSSILD
ncbi:MAG: hypothetical protein V4793_21735, partial [Paraburkholderia tropica]